MLLPPVTLASGFSAERMRRTMWGKESRRKQNGRAASMPSGRFAISLKLFFLRAGLVP